jgi:hypothetical protein
MPSSKRAYEGSITVLSSIFLVVGVAILARTLIAGGGPLSVGTVLGVAFAAVGAGRLWIAARMSA